MVLVPKMGSRMSRLTLWVKMETLAGRKEEESGSGKEE